MRRVPGLPAHAERRREGGAAVPTVGSCRRGLARPDSTPEVIEMTRWTVRHSAAVGLGTAVGFGLGLVLRWRRRRIGDAWGLDLSPMVAWSNDLAGDPTGRARDWPRGMQEDDDVRWRWAPVAPPPATSAG